MERKQLKEKRVINSRVKLKFQYVKMKEKHIFFHWAIVIECFFIVLNIQVKEKQLLFFLDKVYLVDTPYLL